MLGRQNLGTPHFYVGNQFFSIEMLSPEHFGQRVQIFVHETVSAVVESELKPSEVYIDCGLHWLSEMLLSLLMEVEISCHTSAVAFRYSCPSMVMRKYLRGGPEGDSSH